MSFIQHLNLTEDEKKIYELLLNFGNLTAIELANFSGKNFQTVLMSLEALIGKGAVGETTGHIKKYYARIPLSYLGEKSSAFSDRINSNLQSATSALSSEKNKLKDLSEKALGEAEEAIERRKESLDAQVKTKQEELLSDVAKVKEQNSTEIANFQSKLKEDIESVKNEITQELNDKVGKATETISSSKNVIEETRKELSTNIENVVKQVFEQAETDVNLKKDELNTIVTTIQPKLEELKTIYVKEFDSISEIAQTKLELAKVDLREFSEKQATMTLDYSKNITTELEKTVDSASLTVKTHLDTLNNNLENLLNTKAEEMTLKIKESLNSLINDIEAIKGDMVAEMVQQKGAVIASALMKIKDELAIKYTEFANEEQKRKQEFMSEKDIFAQRLEVYYNETIDEFNSKIEEIKVNAEGKLDILNETTLNTISSLTEQIIKTLEDHKEQLISNTSNLKNTIQAELEKNVNLNNEALSNIESMFNELMAANSTKIRELYDNTKTAIEAQTQAISEAILNTAEKIVNESLETTKALVAISKGEIDKTKTFIEEILEREITNSFGIMEESQANLEELAKELMSVSVQLGEDFKTLEAKTKSVKEPEIDTTTITGVDAVQGYIEQILQSTQSKATLFVPSKRSVPVDIVKTLKRTVQLTIITKIDEEMDKEWIDDLVNSAQANIKIRTVREGGIGGGISDLPKLYAVERDSTEVLLAIEDETTQEVTGILSHSTEFAKVLSYTILSNYLTGAASRQIR